jgi:hypothetical protein
MTYYSEAPGLMTAVDCGRYSYLPVESLVSGGESLPSSCLKSLAHPGDDKVHLYDMPGVIVFFSISEPCFEI